MLNIPPFAIFGENIVKYDQIKRSFYFWYFQMERVSMDVISADNFAFIDRIWADWSPGYDATWDLAKVKESIGEPSHFQAAIGYYRAMFDPSRQSPDLADEQAASGQPTPKPTLYLHGRDDGCMLLETVGHPLDFLAPGSDVDIVDKAGHFLHLERPDVVNPRIVQFLKA